MTPLPMSVPSESNEGNRRERVRTLLGMLSLSGVGPAGLKTLLARHGGTVGVLAAMERRGDSAIQTLRDGWTSIDWTQIDQELDIADANDIQYCTLDDDIYPRNLALTNNAPPVLWYKGHLRNLQRKALACVGTTEPSDRGRQRARKFARHCVEHSIQVISGLARGIDGESHRATLEAGGTTVAVLGHGLMHLYPPEHSDLAEEILQTGGALISQFVPTSRATKWTFPQRNEVMCAIAQGTVIIEIELDEKKGSLIQAGFSLKHGRPVFILSSNIDELQSADAARLVESGEAVRVSSFDDVLMALRTAQSEFATVTLFAQGSESRTTAKGVLFDLDGVLWDPTPVMLAAYRTTLTAHCPEPPDDSTLRECLAWSPRKVLKRFHATSGAERRYQMEFQHALRGTVEATAGLTEFIRSLRERGTKVGVVTSQPRSRTTAILQACGLHDLDVIITWNDVPPGRSKPDPAGLLKALDVLALAPADAVYVGDTATDLLAARNARMRSVAVGWGLGTIDELTRFCPDLIIPRPDQIALLLTHLPPAEQAQR